MAKEMIHFTQKGLIMLPLFEYYFALAFLRLQKKTQSNSRPVFLFLFKNP